MRQIIDRRKNGKNKSAVNRQRFIERYKKQIKKAVSDAIGKRSVTDLDSGEKINIPKGDISEPVFHHAKGGVNTHVHPGNKKFTKGDKIKRPPPGGGQGSKASNKGEGDDEFVFEISKDEYLDLLFEDLALPNLKKKQLKQITEYKTVRAGHTTAGVPTNINIVRSLKQSMSRRIALTSGKKRRIEELEKEHEKELEKKSPNLALLSELEQEIKLLKQKIDKTPFIDTFDLRYNNFIKQPKPSSRAVMFCVMDVSGSMDRDTKDIAKRFFILLYLFLTRTYEKIEVVYIRHHTQAKEVDEQEFFYSRETGGTIVSSALNMTTDIIEERYPPGSWNIYVAQASDGDNWTDDSPLCRNILVDRLMPQVQYYAYVEITTRAHQSLWRYYKSVQSICENFDMRQIKSVADIFPVFHDLFKKRVE